MTRGARGGGGDPRHISAALTFLLMASGGEGSGRLEALEGGGGIGGV
jgi:hypothetical protein